VVVEYIHEELDQEVTASSACRVFQSAHTGLRESGREHGYIHACVRQLSAERFASPDLG
jgi:hypothetical protein